MKLLAVLPRAKNGHQCSPKCNFGCECNNLEARGFTITGNCVQFGAHNRALLCDAVLPVPELPRGASAVLCVNTDATSIWGDNFGSNGETVAFLSSESCLTYQNNRFVPSKFTFVNKASTLNEYPLSVVKYPSGMHVYFVPCHQSQQRGGLDPLQHFIHSLLSRPFKPQATMATTLTTSTATAPPLLNNDMLVLLLQHQLQTVGKELILLISLPSELGDGRLLEFARLYSMLVFRNRMQHQQMLTQIEAAAKLHYTTLVPRNERKMQMLQQNSERYIADRIASTRAVITNVLVPKITATRQDAIEKLKMLEVPSVTDSMLDQSDFSITL